MTEEQIIKTISAPRITLKKSSIKNSVMGWEVASSSPTDKEELKEIVKMLEEINKDLKEKFNV